MRFSSFLTTEAAMQYSAVYLLINFAASVFCLQDGLDIFFESNLKEMTDAPIFFDKPVPKWIKGTLVRNGIGRLEVGPRSVKNALDAFGKVASWTFPGDGTASFSTRMVYSDSYKESLKTNTIAPYLLLDATVPPFSAIEELEALRHGPDNTNVNVYNVTDADTNEDTLMVVSDYWKVYALNPHNLTTIKGVSAPIPGVSSGSAGITLSTAHPLQEYGTDNLLTFVSVSSMIPGEKNLLKLMRIKSLSEREQIAQIELDKVPYMHSFGVTKNYAVLIGTPYFVDPINMLKTFRAIDAFDWMPNEVTTLYVIELKTGKVTTLKTENTFFLHVANAFETENNEIIIDVSTYKNIDSLKTMQLQKLANRTARFSASHAYLKRYKLDLNTNFVNVNEFKTLSGNPYIDRLDFPVINENYRYANYCYIYGIVDSYQSPDFLQMGLVKKDVCTNQRDRAFHLPNTYLNEAIFVPNPIGITEDDGVLLMHHVDPVKQETNLTIFDAKDLTPLATSKLPTNIPFSTHAHFFNKVW